MLSRSLARSLAPIPFRRSVSPSARLSRSTWLPGGTGGHREGGRGPRGGRRRRRWPIPFASRDESSILTERRMEVWMDGWLLEAWKEGRNKEGGREGRGVDNVEG